MDNIFTTLTKYRNKGLALSLDKTKNNLSIKGDISRLSAEDKEDIKNNKELIIHFLKEQESAKHLFTAISKVEEKEDYALSATQQRIWYASQDNAVSVIYNIPVVVNLKGNYSVDLLKKSVLSVIERYEILRTVFRVNGVGIPRQVVLTYNESFLTLLYKDFTRKDDAITEINNLISTDSKQFFDLENGPLIRFFIFQLSEDEIILYSNMHHIISDAWSVNVLLKEVDSFYKIFVQGLSSDAVPLSIQFKDYTYWQRGYLESEQSKIDKAYWVDILDQLPNVLDLPIAKRRPSVKTYNGYSLGIFFSPSETLALKKLVKDEGTSFFVGLLVSVQSLLYRYTGERDIIIGTSVTGREHIDLESQIGPFINAIPLRNKFDINLNYGDLIKRFSNVVLEAFKHQEYPSDRILENLKISRDKSRNLLYDVMVTLHNLKEEAAQTELTTILSQDGVIVDIGNTYSKLDLSFIFSEKSGRLFLELNFNLDLYDIQSIKNLLYNYCTLLNNMLLFQEQYVSHIDFISEAEKLPLSAAELSKEELKHIPFPDIANIDDYVIYVVDENLNSIPVGCIGEVCLKRSVNSEISSQSSMIRTHIYARRRDLHTLEFMGADNGTLNGNDDLVQPDNILSSTDPKTGIQIELLQIFEEVLDLKEISLNDNFFDIGGNSIKASLILARIHKNYDVRIDLVNVFTNPIIGLLVKEVELHQSGKFPNDNDPVNIKKMII